MTFEFQQFSWSSGKPFVSGARGLGFISWVGQIGLWLSTARHRCNIPKGAVLPGRNDAEMGPANSLHAFVLYSEYKERFDLINCSYSYGFKNVQNEIEIALKSIFFRKIAMITQRLKALFPLVIRFSCISLFSKGLN